MIYYCSLNMILLNDKFIWIYFLFYILYSTFSTVILTYNVGMLLQSNIDTSITGFFQIEPSRFNIHNFNTAHATFHYNSHNVIWITEAVNNTSSEYPLKYFIIADMLFFHFHFLAEYVNSIWLWKPYITVHVVGSHWLSRSLSLSLSLFLSSNFWYVRCEICEYYFWIFKYFEATAFENFKARQSKKISMYHSFYKA